MKEGKLDGIMEELIYELHYAKSRSRLSHRKYRIVVSDYIYKAVIRDAECMSGLRFSGEVYLADAQLISSPQLEDLEYSITEINKTLC